jgi:hypothetical protein
MSNIVKYNLSTSPNSIQSGNFNIGVNNTPTNLSEFYNGISPVNGGYTIYINKVSGGPSIYVPQNDNDLIQIVKQLGGSVSTAADALVWINSQSTMTVLNNNYPSIVTDGLVLNLDAGFVSSYPKTGTTWKDLSGSGNTGTLINGVSYSGESGGAIVLDGTDDMITIGVGNNYPYPYNTLEIWVKTSGLGSGMSAAGLFGLDFGRTVTILSNGNISYAWYTGVGVNQGNLFNVTTTGVNLFDNQWHHVICSRGTSVFEIYVDGILKLSGGNGGEPSWNGLNIWSSMSSVIGNNPNDGIYRLKGLISNAKMYNRQLSSTEVLQNYNAGLQRFIPTNGLVLSLDAQNTNLYAVSTITAYDVSGNNNNGTLINGVQYVGDGNGSWKFDGTDDYINVTHNTSLNLASQGTISTWINPFSLTQGLFTNIVAKNTGGAVNQQSYTLSWRQVSGGLYGQICDGLGTYNEVLVSFPTVANVWYNIVFTWNGSQLAIYNNGVVVGTSTQTINNQSLLTDLTIGGYTYKGDGGGDEYFNGKISQIYIYNRGLTSTEILTIYNATKTRYGL